MGFEKGHKKLGGRQIGSKNRSTKEIQDRLKYIIDDNLERLLEDFENLDSVTRVKTLSAYLKYVMPTQRESALEVSLPEGKLNVESEDVIDSILQGLRKESLTDK